MTQTLINARTGAAVGEFAAAQVKTATELRRAQHAATKGQLDLDRLPALERELETLTDRERDRAANVALLEPEVRRLEADLKAKVAGHVEAKKQFDAKRVAGNLRHRLDGLQREVERAEDEYKFALERLDRNRAVLAATKKSLADWHERNDAELQALRELDLLVDPNGSRNFHTHRLGSRGPQDLPPAQ